MSALLQESIFRAKIDEKLHVFWDIDFEWILGGFGDDKTVDFPIFFRTFFDAKLRMQLECKKNSKKEADPQIGRNVRGQGEGF